MPSLITINSIIVEIHRITFMREDAIGVKEKAEHLNGRTIQNGIGRSEMRVVL